MIAIAPVGGRNRIRDDGRFLTIWKRQTDGVWKMWQMIWNSTKPIGIGTNRYMWRFMQKKSRPPGNRNDRSQEIPHQHVVDASRSGDVDALVSLFADDAVVMPPNDTTLYGNRKSVHGGRNTSSGSESNRRLRQIATSPW